MIIKPGNCGVVLFGENYLGRNQFTPSHHSLLSLSAHKSFKWTKLFSPILCPFSISKAWIRNWPPMLEMGTVVWVLWELLGLWRKCSSIKYPTTLNLTAGQSQRTTNAMSGNWFGNLLVKSPIKCSLGKHCNCFTCPCFLNSRFLVVENVCSLNNLSSNSCSPPVLMIIEVAAAAQRCVTLDERGACDCVTVWMRGVRVTGRLAPQCSLVQCISM